VFAVAGKIKVWDLEKRKYIKTFDSHTESMYYFSISADGRWGTSTGEDKTVRFWDMESGTCLRVLKGLNVYPHALAMSADGGVAVSCGNDGVLMVWDLLNGISDEGKNNLDSRRTYIPSVDGNIFVSGKYGSAFKVWTSEFEEMWRIATVEAVNALALSADGRRAVSGHRSGVLKVWDTHSGQCTGNLEGHMAGIVTAALSADGRFAISAGWDHTIRFWDTASRLCLVQIPIEAAAMDMPAVVLSADGSLALTGGKDKLVKVWETASGKLLRQFKGHTGIITSIALSLDNKLAFSASRDHTLRVWEMRTGKCIGIKGHPYSFNQISLVNEDVRAVDTSYEATDHALRNYSLPDTDQIEQILSSLTDGKKPSPFETQVMKNQSMSDIPNNKEDRPANRYCNECGYRVTLDTAKDRGLTDMGNFDCMMVWCYYYDEPVDPNHHRRCPHWIKYTELDYDLNPPQ
jgi:WD40 repeat protein